MADGYLGKCKDCTKDDTKKRISLLKTDESFTESERKRGRDKYYRLGYKDRYKQDKSYRSSVNGKYKAKYPEKYLARNASQRIECPNGYHNHHWSYLEIHRKDVIIMPAIEHAKIHRYMSYDEKYMMYRDMYGNLLDTREKHMEYVNQIKELE